MKFAIRNKQNFQKSRKNVQLIFQRKPIASSRKDEKKANAGSKDLKNNVC